MHGETVKLVLQFVCLFVLMNKICEAQQIVTVWVTVHWWRGAAIPVPKSAPFRGGAPPYIHDLGTTLRLLVIFMPRQLYSGGRGGRSLSTKYPVGNNKLMVHMYIVKNTTIFLIVRLLLIRYNYMFRPSMLAIFRLYIKNLCFMYNLNMANIDGRNM